MNREAIVAVRDAKREYENAMARGGQVAIRKQAYINILLNNIEALLELDTALEKAEAETAALMKENMKLKAEVKKLKAPVPDENPDENSDKPKR